MIVQQLCSQHPPGTMPTGFPNNRRAAVLRAVALAAFLAIPFANALAGPGALKRAAMHSSAAVVHVTHRCFDPADRPRHDDMRRDDVRRDPHPHGPYFLRCGEPRRYENDGAMTRHRYGRDERMQDRGGDRFTRRERYEEDRFDRPDRGRRDGFDRSPQYSRFEDRRDAPRADRKHRKRRPWSYPGCGPRCWLRRAQRGYCGHGCDYYLNR